MSYQTRIENITNSIRLLLIIQAFKTREKEPEENGEQAEDLVWTVELFSFLLGWPESKVRRVINWTKSRHYITEHLGTYLLTDVGVEFSRAAMRRPEIRGAISAWKNEVLTGINPKGKQSKIDTAVLPGAEDRPVKAVTAEDILSASQLRLQARKRHARALGLSLEEFDAGVQSGRVRICDNTGESHIGIFDKKGNGWQHLCRRCRKAKRRKKNV